MAALTTPNLKDENIVCQNPCNHKDCRALRKKWANVICAICGKPLVHPQRFYVTEGIEPEYLHYHSDLVHANCLEEDIENSRKSSK